MRLFASKARGKGDKGWVEDFIRAQSEALALVHTSMSHEDFLAHCIAALPRQVGMRDTRKQRVVRTVRRMHERGDLPFRVESDRFVFE